MTDEQNQPVTDEVSTETPKPDELQMLKERARMMGIKFSNNIGLETLKTMVQKKMDGEDSTEPTNQENPPALADPSIPAAVKKETLRQRLLRENMRLIRLRITNMDPKKKDLPGEVFTVANEYIGTVRKFIPFGEVTENGYHVPYVIYKMMKRRKFLNIRTFKDRKNNNQIKVESSWAQEFALEVLDPLTPTELRQLAIAQQAAGST
jgi:hypothetical protein